MGCLVVMGIVCAPAQDLYWSKDKLFHVSSIKERFTKTRFENSVDNTTENPQRNQPGHDKLIHVPTILEPVCENFKSQYLQWIHERFSSLHKKGWGGVPETNLDGRVVLDLMDPILNLGHHVYCDRFLPSPDLFLKLWEKATVACGTGKANRKGMPKNLVQVKLKNQGNSLIQQKGNLVDSVWKDKRKLKKIPVADRPRQIFLLFLPLIVNNYQFLAELYSMKTQGVVPCVSLLLLTTLYPEL